MLRVPASSTAEGGHGGQLASHFGRIDKYRLCGGINWQSERDI